MATNSEQRNVDHIHLVVLIHGLWGNPSHLQYLRDTLEKQHPPAKTGLHILLPQSNANNFTYDGIELGGERITNEIEETIRDLEKQGSTVTKFSITGYSLGGLVARYVVGLLHKSGVFNHVQPCNFTTFATPHLGVRAPTRGYATEAWNFLGSRTLSTSGQQMFLADEFRDSGRNLLDVMADPDSAFLIGLRSFKNKYIYANTNNDRSVPYYTAAISRTDPFLDMDVIDVHYLPGHETLLDPSGPASKRTTPPPDTNQSIFERFTITQRTRKAVTFYALFASLMPIAVPLFLANAGYQTFKSAQRIRLHEEGNLLDLKRYRIPLLEEAQAVQDRMLERVAAERTNNAEQYLPTPPPEPAHSPAASSTTTLGKNDINHTDEKESSSFPTLALSDTQFRMIDNLDQVGFTKYAAHIINVRHTHAAIVVRSSRSSFDEGRAVVAHWAEQFEV